MTFDSQQTPTLAGLLTTALDTSMRGVRVALPGRIETYDPVTQTCSVQPLVKDGVIDETGVRTPERLPIVASVPVCFLGSGAFSITWPIKVGDTVLLVFSSSSIDRWLALGGEVDPIDDRRQHITDAIAIPGLRDLGHVLPSSAVDPSAMVISGPGLKLGTSATDAALKGDAFVTALDTLITSISTAVGTIAGGTTAAANILTAKGVFDTAATSYKSTIVKVG